VFRQCRFEDASALRLVDFLGSANAMTRAGAGLQDLLRRSGAEYLDFFCSGMRPELAAAGFHELPPAAASPIVLPGHFEPFERSNVELVYSLRGPGDIPIVCKGDADQDRPNLLSTS
jgi:hypothetical protein